MVTIKNKTISGALRFRFYDQLTLVFSCEEALPAEVCVLGADIDLDVFTAPCVLSEATPDGGTLTFEVTCNRQAFLDKIEKMPAKSQKGWVEIRAKSDMRLIASGTATFEKSVFVEGFAVDPGIAEPVATVGYVDESIAALQAEIEPKLDAIKLDTEAILTQIGTACATLEGQLDG